MVIIPYYIEKETVCILLAGVLPVGWCAPCWLVVAHRWRWCLLGAGGSSSVAAASYCQPIPSRRAGENRFRAAGLIRATQSFRGNRRERIALNINYLYSPVGRKKTR